MFDHVTIRVSDLDESRRFYERALALLGFGEPTTDGHFYEWNDFSISQAGDDRPATRHLHVGLVARSHEIVDEFWRTLTEEGFRDDGPPGPREQYRPGYYGSFVLDPDGNSVEAVYKDNLRLDAGCIDHLWLRVRDVDASVAFYETVAPVLGFRLQLREHEWAHFRGGVGSFRERSYHPGYYGAFVLDPDGNNVEAVCHNR